VTDDALEEILGRVPISRRKFVRRVVLGSAFAVPFVASFEMGTLSAGASAVNNCLGFNQSSTGTDGTYTLVTFHTATSPSPNLLVLTFFVEQAGRNVSSPQLPVTLVDYTSRAFTASGGYFTSELGTSATGQPEPLTVPQRVPFRPSTTIHPPGYYQLLLNVTQAKAEAGSEAYAGDTFYFDLVTFSFKVGNDPHVITLPGNPGYSGPAAIASGPYCNP
jgi:hypothetical protein